MCLGSQVAQNVYDLLKPGGRYAAEMGGQYVTPRVPFFYLDSRADCLLVVSSLNMVAVRSHLHAILRERGDDPAALDPWYFPTPDAYCKILESVGFRVESIELVPRITALPTGKSLDRSPRTRATSGLQR